MHDLAIIGGGPTGINCGIAASEAHLDYVILEKGMLVNSIYNFPANMTFFSTSKKLEIGNVPFISHNDKPTRQEALEYYRRILEAYDLNIQFNKTVSDLNDEGDYYTIVTSDGPIKAKHVIIATGFYDQPVLMNVPGEDLPKVKHYYDDVHYYIRKKVIVVGGANSACDVALECWQKGAEVTMIVRESDLYEKVKYWILPNIKNRIAEGSIKAYFNATIKEIKPKEVIIENPEGEKVIENDFVLAMTGYQPNYNFLKKIGVKVNDDQYKTPFHDEHTLETNLKNVYIAGVINGGLKTNKYFIENTRDHADRIIQDIEKKISYA